MAPDDALYGLKRQRRMNGEKSSFTTGAGLSFASELGSLINSKDDSKSTSSKASKLRARKEDIFTAHARNATDKAKARKAADSQQPFGQTHTVDGDRLDDGTWNRSKRRMEEKARLYSAMKRGDLEDEDEKYAVDFDRKWIQGHDGEEQDLSSSDDDGENEELVEYTDEFGRTRKGTRAEAARAQRQQRDQAELQGDRFTARPVAPSKVIYGDTIQHQAFNPDAHIEAQMEALAKKRDRSLTPPPDMHFDSKQEIRQKGTGFFAFSDDATQRKRQMDNLEQERLTTQRKRKEREEKLRADVLERDRDFQDDNEPARQKRRAEEFLTNLTEEMHNKKNEGLDAMQRIEAALAQEHNDT